MIDALNATDPASLELVHLDAPSERAYWAHVLSVSEDELEQIVDKVGPRAIDVRRHLMRARHAEWQRVARRSQHHIAPSSRASGGDSLFLLVVGGVGIAATTFGALAYALMPPDEWTVFQREHGCEAAANSDPTIKQVRCPDGRTIVRTNLAGTTDTPAARQMR